MENVADLEDRPKEQAAIEFFRSMKNENFRKAIIEIATRDLDYDKPDKYNDWFYSRMGYKYAHCATAVSYWYHFAAEHCGVGNPLAGIETAEGVKYVPIMVTWARKNGKTTKAPKMGDCVCFDWDKNGGADHIGIFEKWEKEGVSFWCLEANTAETVNGNQSHGGRNARKLRYVQSVIEFVNVID